MSIAEWVAIGSLAVAIVTVIAFVTNIFKWIGTEGHFREAAATLEKEVIKAEKRYNEQRNLLLILCVALAVMLALLFARSQVRDKSS